jgi:surface protein
MKYTIKYSTGGAIGELLKNISTGPITELLKLSSITDIYKTCYGNKQTCSQVHWKHILETKNIIDKDTFFDKKELRKADNTIIDTITEGDWEKYKDTCQIIRGIPQKILSYPPNTLGERKEKDNPYIKEQLDNKKHCIIFFKYVEKTIRTNLNIRQAVTAWKNNEESAIATYGHISHWDVSAVTDMGFMFASGTTFNGDISSWDVSAVTNMRGMFSNTTAFNGDLSSWDVSAVVDMERMFFDATAFNGDLSSWDVSAVTDMGDMFNSATAFNGALSSWEVSAVTNMERMFYRATAFNGDLISWDVSAVTNMEHMFNGAIAFNGDLSSWDMSAVTNLEGMFRGATSFNGDLSSWDVSAVTNMSYMFQGATAFGDLPDWYGEIYY